MGVGVIINHGKNPLNGKNVVGTYIFGRKAKIHHTFQGFFLDPPWLNPKKNKKVEKEH